MVDCNPRERTDNVGNDDNQLTMQLKVNGEDVPTGAFVQRIISSGILGMIKALKGTDDPKEIEITIRVQ